MSQIEAAKASAEETLGFLIPEDIAREVLEYAKRKRFVAGKPESYLPLLYENELTDYFMRLEINLRGEINYVRNLQPARALA